MQISYLKLQMMDSLRTYSITTNPLPPPTKFMEIEIPIYITKGFLFQSFTKLYLIQFPIHKTLS
jgi:hypothetical protein